jgi:photosystem II stability/assembly factor-like uncharacterized protein
MKKILLTILLAVSFCANAQFWTEKATGFTTPDRSLNSISIVDANVIWANAFDNFDPSNQDYTVKEYTKSTDGGNTWIPGTIDLGANSTDMGSGCITAISATTAWISVIPGAINTGGIWKTTDGGINWNKQTTALFNNALESYANFVYFWDVNNGVAQGDPEGGEFEIYTTSDGGTNWIRVPAANIPDPDIAGEYGYNNRHSISGNTIWFGTDKGRIFKSSDKGLTWTVSNSVYSTDFALDRFTFSDANKGLLAKYVLDQPSLLYSTTDGGENWIPVITSGTIFKDHITYILGTSIVVSAQESVTSNGNTGSSYSTDDGLTWTTIDSGVFHGTLAFLNDTFGFSAGINTSSTVGGISKFTGIPLKAPSFDAKNKISAYPNPTNGILHLNSENSLIKQASVFDLLGRKVYNPEFSALNKVDLDLKSLQTGAYILKVTSDSGKMETMKIMKN